jgi:hypothetical protein
VVNIAIQHTRKQLFQPFRMGQWARLALVGLLAGELGSGGCNTGSFPGPQSGGGGHANSGMDPATLVVLIAAAIVIALVVGLVFMYLNSMMRFVLFDSIVSGECRIREFWRRRKRPGFRFFVWQIVFVLVTGAAAAILIGIPAAVALAAGWLQNPKDHILPLVLGGICLFFMFLAFFIVMLTVVVITKDFVVPLMALEDVSAFEGWRRLLVMLKAEKGSYAIYILLKVGLAIAAGIVFGIINLIVMLMLVLPMILFGLAGVLAGKSAGLEWNVYTITLAVVFGSIALAVLMYVLAMIYVPAIVFFPAYAIHFFASRYPALDAALHPAPPEPPPPPFLPLEPVPV